MRIPGGIHFLRRASEIEANALLLRAWVLGRQRKTAEARADVDRAIELYLGLSEGGFVHDFQLDRAEELLDYVERISR